MRANGLKGNREIPTDRNNLPSADFYYRSKMRRLFWRIDSPKENPTNIILDKPSINQWSSK